jgi:hypothetical protein
VNNAEFEKIFKPFKCKIQDREGGFVPHVRVESVACWVMLY